MDRFTWGIAAGAAALVAAALISVIVLQRTAPPPDLSRPDGVVRAYVEALETGRPERAWDLLAESARRGVSRETFIQRATAIKSGPQTARITIEEVVIEGNTARVELGHTYESSGGPFGSSVYTSRSVARLEREGGEWRITVPPEPYLLERAAPPLPPVTVQVTVVAPTPPAPTPTLAAPIATPAAAPPTATPPPSPQAASGSAPVRLVRAWQTLPAESEGSPRE
jgi:hypothetical protein